MFKLISFCLLISVDCLNPAAAMPGAPYDAATIPKQLQAYANAVVRHQESVTELRIWTR
jgi:hypothetical protein